MCTTYSPIYVEMSLSAKDKQLFERLERTSYNNQAKVFINAYWEKGIQPQCEEVSSHFFLFFSLHVKLICV